VPAKHGRQNHAQHVLAVAKVTPEQEYSPAALSDQRNNNYYSPMVEQIPLTTNKISIIIKI
jgi:hypothetical protein